MTTNKNIQVTIIGDRWNHRFILDQQTVHERRHDLFVNSPISGGAEALMKTLAIASPDIAIGGSFFVPEDDADLSEDISLVQWYSLNDFDCENIAVLRESRTLGGNASVKTVGVGSKIMIETQNKYNVLILYQRNALHIPERYSNIINETGFDQVIWMPVEYGDNSTSERHDEAYNFLKCASSDLHKKTVVFLKTQRLASHGIGKRDNLSLESCLSGLYNAFQHNDRMKDLLVLKEIVIFSGIDFAFVFKTNGNCEIQSCQVLFRPLRTCEFYRRDIGFLSGYSFFYPASCINAYASGNANWLTEGIADAMERSYDLFRTGLTQRRDMKNKKNIPGKQSHYNVTIEKICENAYSDPQARGWPEKELGRRNVSSVLIDKHPESIEHIAHWSMVEHQIRKIADGFVEKTATREEREKKRDEIRLDIAKVIVEKGIKDLSKTGLDVQRSGVTHHIHVPVAQIGNMTVIDPSEVENYRFIQSLIREYADANWGRPLGIGVFGPPGGGKSFGVKEVAQAALNLKNRDRLKIVECNLAQLTAPEELSRKLHDAQDLGLEKNIPIVFLDEFDSMFEGRTFGWFKYLLPLLQDGIFKLGESEYHLGKAVVVCAGGLHRTFEELATRQRDNAFIEAKGPDLLGRLRAHVNTLGPNRFDDHDRLYRIRRAIILRSIIKRKMPSIIAEKTLAIDPHLLNAFIRVSDYRHGTRSLEALIEMSVPAFGKKPRKYVRAMLPPEAQLNIHTHAREFFRILDGIEEN